MMVIKMQFHLKINQKVDFFQTLMIRFKNFFNNVGKKKRKEK